MSYTKIFMSTQVNILNENNLVSGTFPKMKELDMFDS